MEWVIVLRWLHVIGACVLLGTGAGIAFFMLMAHRTGDVRIIAHTARIVVIADWLFTASAVIAQPITGMLLAQEIGWSLSEPWLLLSIGLYILTGLFWLPVVWMQIRMKKMADEACSRATPLPKQYYLLFRLWFACGVPAFTAVVAIIWLMLARPDL